MIHVSAPDARGFCSLGVSVDCTRAALCTAKIIVGWSTLHLILLLLILRFEDCGHSVNIILIFAAQVNEHMPCVASTPPNDIELEIGKFIAQRLVEDGATLQLGIGNIPDAVLCALANHKDLGVHSEMIGDTIVDLIERGCITNKLKLKHRGRVVCSLGIGTKRLYDFLHNNPFVGMNYQLFYI